MQSHPSSSLLNKVSAPTSPSSSSSSSSLSMAYWWSDANNWDLHAVVRGCSYYTNPSTASTSSTVDPFALLKEEFLDGEDVLISHPDLSVTAENTIHELEELCKPFFSKPNPQPSPSRGGSPSDPQKPQHRSLSHTTRSRKRKNQGTKKVVCHVPANGVSADMWAWRKYGQKPIKGSPYPRGYYRCSSSKACMARKLVERSCADPTKIILTYTGEHDHPLPTHRNSLAGSTRSKFPSLSSTSDGSGANKSSPLTEEDLSPRTPLTSSMDDELADEIDIDQLIESTTSQSR